MVTGQRDRLRYQLNLEERMAFEWNPAKAKEVATAYRDIRRGWVLGEPGFQDWMWDKIDEAGGDQNDSLRRLQRQEHGKKSAENPLASALNKLRTDAPSLREMKQTSLEKQAVVWSLQTKTTVTGIWIANHLQMGPRMNVLPAGSRFRNAGECEVKRLNKKY
jgi:hypothetical protein